MKRAPQLDDEQVADVRAWLRLLIEEHGSQTEVGRLTGLNPSTISGVLKEHQRPGRSFWEALQEWDQTDAEPEAEAEGVAVIGRNKYLTADALPSDYPIVTPKDPEPSAVEVLGRVEVLLRRAHRELSDPKRFRPLLRPGIEQLSRKLDEALELLAFED